MMRWSERQIVMLMEMGLRPWAPPEPAEPDANGNGFRHPSARGEPLAEHPQAPAERAAPVRMDPVVRRDDGRGGAARGDVSTMDWPTLREAVAACTACGLCEGRRNTVFGVGHPHAHWMVVGEAPGQQEDIQGEPFVGKSGQLLDHMLRAVGLSRHAAADGADEPARQVFIANTLKCRPPGNRNPQPQELAQCEPFLIRQIELVQPKIILAMGRFAVQSLLRSDEPIGRLRGRVHHYHGVPLVVTYHPAYLLRNPEDKARAWDDLCLAAETVRAGATPSA